MSNAPPVSTKTTFLDALGYVVIFLVCIVGEVVFLFGGFALLVGITISYGPWTLLVTIPLTLVWYVGGFYVLDGQYAG